MQIHISGKMVDFRLIGKNQDRIVIADRNELIKQYKIDLDQKTCLLMGILSLSRSFYWEAIKSIAVCDKNEHILVEVMNKNLQNCSRVIILKAEGEKLIKKATINTYKSKGKPLATKQAIEFYGYFGSRLLWVGLSKSDNGVVQVYDYDSISGDFVELQEKRISHREKDPVKLHRVGNKFCFTGRLGKVMSLSLKL